MRPRHKAAEYGESRTGGSFEFASFNEAAA